MHIVKKYCDELIIILIADLIAANTRELRGIRHSPEEQQMLGLLMSKIAVQNQGWSLT